MKIFFIILAVSFNLSAQEVTPTRLVSQSINFSDDQSFENLDIAIERQLASQAYANLSGTIKFGGKVYSKKVLKDSLILFKTLTQKAKDCMKTGSAQNCLQIFNRDLNAMFSIYKPVPGKNEMGYGQAKKTTQYTSYYSPDLNGSRVRTERFKRAIYSMPTNPADQNYTRVQIDYKGALEGKGHEIFYVEDSFYDLYLLHVQGGGRIKVHNADGSVDIRYLSYNGKNTRAFKMVYHYMKERGYLSGDAGVPAQRRFLQENPDKEEEVFSTCPSYVYFKESSEEPVGVNNIPLTEGRSLAIDYRIYKTSGLINFVKAVRPTEVLNDGSVKKVNFSRFYIAQDTGGAIRGNARVDLYAGYGPAAELAAYNTNDLGEQYFLIKK